MAIDKWLEIRSFSHAEFSDIDRLIRKKQNQNQIISLCLPSLNEAATIGKIIRTLKKSLHDQKPLIDEILVIDSGSTDGTQEIARQEGALVFQSSEILPETGNYRGKGENLWKSLQVANGDLVVWIDTDIRNIHPRFVTALIGPLLAYPEISFVKSFYRRPIRVGKKLQATGGGRVTEILVKPFFNLLFPQLALFNQPLSGEYAGRRELLERVPFFTGYGVEAGLLIDIEQRFGLSCMAQVDLDVRIHRNQDLQSLRKMAFGILRVLMTRAEQQGKLVLLDNMNNHFISLLKDENDTFKIRAEEIYEIERAPIIRCEAYQKKRQFQDDDLILLDETPKKLTYPIVSLSNLLDQRLIILDGPAGDKETVLEEISRLLVRQRIAKNYPQLIHDFYKRENILSTGIGSGVAIPHDLSSNINQMKIVIYRRRAGIQFDSMDGQPVRLIFAVVGPPTRRRYYLQVLANLSTILRDKQVKAHLLNARTTNEFICKLRKIEVMKRIERELRLVEA